MEATTTATATATIVVTAAAATLLIIYEKWLKLETLPTLVNHWDLSFLQ